MTTVKLQDVTRAGRERPWRMHKVANEILSAAYESVDTAKAARLRECATMLQFTQQAEGLRLRRANFCRVRLCPMCSWRRSLKVAGQMQQIMEEIQAKEPMAYVLLTLTVRNVSGDDLGDTIDAMMQGWNRFVQRVAYKDAVKGYYRALEITHNLDYSSEFFDSFHPHFHVLLAVKPSYFTSRYYLSQAKWMRLWQEAMRLSYSPSVDVRRVKGNSAAAVAEVAKYAVKPGDFLTDDWDLTVDTVRLLDQVLHRRRFIAFGGLFAEVHRSLHLDDMEDGDLVLMDPREQALEEEKLLSFVWYSGYRQYVQEK